jgi:hypothetical protein
VGEYLVSRPVALGSELTSTNANASDRAGFDVAASADGTRIAYVVLADDQGGTDAGAVRVFDWNGTAWTQVGSDILGSSSTPVYKTALSDNGSRVFLSSQAGNYVRAYDYDTGTSDWVQTGSDITGTGSFGWEIACSANGNRVVIGARTAGSGGEVEVYDWNGTAWTQVGATITTGTAAADGFGDSVSISENGSRIAVGSTGDDTGGTNVGSVRIFDWNGTAWTQVGTDITGVTSPDGEGYTVWLSSDGSRVATAAANVTTTGFGTTSSGRARVFEYDTGTSDWVQMGTEIYGVLTSDLARQVSLSGDGTRLAIGSLLGHTVNIADVGCVRVFDWNGHEWAQFDESLFLSSPGNADYLGSSVALSRDGSTLIGGAYLDDVGGVTNAGSVKIWSVPAPTWKQQGGDVQFTLADSGEQFGRNASFSADGSRFVAGAWSYGPNQGAVEMFEFNTTTLDWDSIGTITGVASTQYFGFGNSMSADGSTIVVGAYGANSFVGYVEVYDYGGGTTWTKRGSTINGTSTSSYFGQSVDISADGDRIVIGAYGTNKVYVYDWTGSNWSLAQTFTGPANSEFGTSVSITPDGETIAVGAPAYNSYTYQGLVGVYNYNGTSWALVGSFVLGPSTSAYFGISVDLSANGSRFIVGAFQNDDVTNNAGETRVYDWNGTSWVQVGSDINGVRQNDYNGIAVGITESGSRIGVYSYGYDDGGATDTGLYQIFDYDTATSDWVQFGQSVVGEVSNNGAVTKLDFTSSGDKFLAVDSGYDSPAANDGRVRVFQIVKAPGFKYWDGTAFVDSTAVQYWNGTAWTDVTGIQYWNGSAWTDPS